MSCRLPALTAFNIKGLLDQGHVEASGVHDSGSAPLPDLRGFVVSGPEHPLSGFGALGFR